MSKYNHKKRTLALILAGIMTLSGVTTAAAAPIGSGVTPTCDEAYYATLDYYGNLLEGSVVKSYALNGVGELTDYGVYDEVINLTDGTPVSLGEGSAAFRFDQAPGHFYFEGKTEKPFQHLPWTVTLRYTLNGVPVQAEELAGKQGVVEILLDIVPNRRASSYARYNYTLEAMALFNEDDILSLEAEGAQVQLVGNLRTVLFMCLPGEEQHFTIRVGSNDFSFGGMTILMVPATLAQLEEIAKLSQRKDDLEEDYEALSGSLDALLDALNEVQGGLYASADGLDRLDTARGTISRGKGQIYTDAGVLRGDLSNLADLLEPVEQRALALSQAITGSKAALNEMADTAVSLRTQLEDLEEALEGLEDGSGDVKQVIRTAADLKSSLRSLQRTLGSSGMSGVDLPTNTGDNVRLVKLAHGAYATGDPVAFADSLRKLQAATGSTGGPSEAELAQLFAGKGHMTFENFCTQITGSPALGKDMSDLWTVYSGGQVDVPTPLPAPPAGETGEQPHGQSATAEESGSAGEGGSEPESSAGSSAPADSTPDAPVSSGNDSGSNVSSGNNGSGNDGTDDAGAVDAPDTGDPAADGGAGEKDAGGSQGGDNPVADVIVDRLDSASDRLNQLQSELNSTLNSISRSTGTVVGDLASLCAQLDDLVDLVDDAEDLSAALRQSSVKLRDILDGVAALQTVLNEYEPTLQESVANVGALSTSAVSALRDLETLLADTEALMKTAGGQLDDGTHQALQGLADTLRQTAKAMAATGDVRDAKATINSIIEDTWNEYTGDINNILLMDAGAQAVSLTDSRNPAPSSVQILIRTQEIKAEELTAEQLAAAAPAKTTFWGRIAQMFRDFWNAITGIFRGKGT